MRGYEKVSMQHLSMGMTHDFEVAIEEGATIVRIGTADIRETDNSCLMEGKPSLTLEKGGENEDHTA